MDSFLEKITLYDFFSDFVPGALCLILCACGILPELATYKELVGDNFSGYIGFAFVILCYVSGVAISEIARGIFTELPQCLSKKLCKSKEKKKTPKWLQKLKVDEQTLKNALVESGISQSSIENAMKVCAAEKISLAEYFNVRIFADIQVDPNYKRLHNYSSSESMNKNLAVAFLFGGVVPLLLMMTLHVQILERFWLLCGLEVILAVIFFFRWKRFAIKKSVYAVSWFVEKYNVNEKEKEDINTTVSERFLNLVYQYWERINLSMCGYREFSGEQDQKDLAEKMKYIFYEMHCKIPEEIVSKCRELYTVLYTLLDSDFNNSEFRELFKKKYEEVEKLLKVKNN